MLASGQLLRHLATSSGRLTGVPADHARRLDPLDRALHRGEKTQNGLLDQRTGAVIGWLYASYRHNAIGKLWRRQRLRVYHTCSSQVAEL